MYRVKSNRVLGLISVIVIALVCGMMVSTDWADAASGKFGGCSVSRNYRHPVTGVIEDSGGEGSFATGQGMVESCAYGYGMLEQTDDGQCYFTVRLTLQDMVNNVSFSSQVRGGSGWSSLGTSVTNQGSDDSGVTKDYCVKVPSTECVLRCSMYVEPMGRDVVYYLSPSGFDEGNTNGMVVTHVTSSSNSGSNNSDSNSNSNSGSDTNKDNNSVDKKAQAKEASKKAIASVEEKIDAIGKVTIEKEGLIQEARAAYDSLKPAQKKKVENYDVLKAAEEKLLSIKTKEIEKPDIEKTLNAAKGLTLSTEKEKAEGSGSTAAIILGVIVLIAAAGGGGYYVVQRKKKGSGDTRDDDQ